MIRQWHILHNLKSSNELHNCHFVTVIQCAKPLPTMAELSFRAVGPDSHLLDHRIMLAKDASS